MSDSNKNYRNDFVPARKVIVTANILLKEGVVEQKIIKIGDLSDKLLAIFNEHFSAFEDKIETTSVSFSIVDNDVPKDVKDKISLER